MRIADLGARGLITIGGIGTIVAVLGVCLFLLWVVLPLFLPARIESRDSFAAGWEGRIPVHLGLDEFRVLGWSMQPDGTVRAFRLDTGETRFETRLFEGGRPTAASFRGAGGRAVLGFEDGTIRLAEIGFETSFLASEHVSGPVLEALRTREKGAAVDLDDGVVQLTPEGQVRLQTLRTSVLPATRIGTGPVLRLAHVEGSAGPFIAALVEEDGKTRLRIVSGREKADFLTGRTSFVLDDPVDLPYEPLSSEPPRYLAVSGLGNGVYVGWRDGSLLRIDCSDRDNPFVEEKGQLVESGTALTAMSLILGNTTLTWGDSGGGVHGGFPVRLSEFRGQGLWEVRRDPVRSVFALVRAKRFGSGQGPVLSLEPSGRSRLLLAGSGDGLIRLFNATSERELGRFRIGSGEPVVRLVMAPKEDGFLALTPDRLYHFDLDPRYPEAGFAALFRPVWYEGYGEPLHMWQSSSGTDDFEPKLGLVPLIFGTVKATVYSMLFGFPIALLAAIFTSEFLHPRTKAAIKPTIELMASLPSVVLGFLAALVFAPLVEAWVATVLTGFLTLPLAFFAGAYLWQLLPARAAPRLARIRFLFILLVVPAGVGLAILLGPVLEGWLFAGDIRAWLAWNPAEGSGMEYASAVGGWLLLLLPLSVLVIAVFLNRWVNPLLRRGAVRWNRRQYAQADLAKFAVGLLAAVVLALLLAVALDRFGFDPRGGLVATYVQRNALVVGFVMGFAIIPIIYTISEDALSSVPEHLRSASLGSGATPWQTAIRIVIPTAMSGLFSAMMVGLGRAVGETMIVLMAAGNTPVLEWNIFEGFRTLSANIAVELPEAVRNSTHYRTLFLAALALFAMTFVVNTVAEIVRLRFRKRAYEL